MESGKLGQQEKGPLREFCVVSTMSFALHISARCTRQEKEKRGNNGVKREDISVHSFLSSDAAVEDLMSHTGY